MCPTRKPWKEESVERRERPIFSSFHFEVMEQAGADSVDCDQEVRGIVAGAAHAEGVRVDDPDSDNLEDRKTEAEIERASQLPITQGLISSGEEDKVVFK